MGRHPSSFKLLSNQLVREAVKTLSTPAPAVEPVKPVSKPALVNGYAKRSGDELQDDAARKKRRTDDTGDVHSADEIVSYTRDNLPADLRKYYAHRHTLFSLYNEGIQMDREGWWSVTPENIAAHIAERCRCDTIVDAFCGVGGNAIQFAFTCEKVIAIDNNPIRLACARHNAEIYGVSDRIEFICADFVEWARTAAPDSVEVVFLSPPWGGIDYRSPTKPSYFEAGDRIGSSLARQGRGQHFDLETLKPLPADELLSLARNLAREVALYLPKTTDLAQVAALAPNETVEVEQQFMGDHFKAITAYFGDLAQPPP